MKNTLYYHEKKKNALYIMKKKSKQNKKNPSFPFLTAHAHNLLLFVFWGNVVIQKETI